MKFPSLLLQKNRKRLLPNRIKKWNYMYTRHKPSTNWNIDENLPDFTKIKINQSFNWCNFSIPIWARFNDKEDYFGDYAVAGFNVKTIREKHLESEMFKSKVIDVEHKPLCTNYSHCELIIFKRFGRLERREIRMSFRHNCIVPLKPNEKQSKFHIFVDIMIMFIRRLFSRNINL